MKRFATHTAHFLLLASAALLAIAIPNAMAQGTISQGGAEWEYTNTNSTSGNADFRIDGTDNVFQAWWWYRIDGDTEETAFPDPDAQDYIGNVATLDWADVDSRGFAAQAIDWVTEGGGGGSGTTLQDLTLSNNTGGALDIEVFLYIDFDVGADASGDEAVLTNPNNFITITDDDGTTAEFRGVGADAYQVTVWDDLRTALQDAAITDLDNTGLPFGPGDYTGAFQWSASIPDGESQLFRGVASVDESAPLVSGWRLLSVPGGDLTVQDLADRNLVQGLSDSYPGGDPNLLVNYDGPTDADYTAAASTAEALAPGKGFFWHLYDDADFGGTPPPEFVDVEEFQFPIAFGTEQVANVDVPFAAMSSGAPAPYMLGNPFQAAFDVDGVVQSAGDGTLQTNFSSWDPGSQSYVTRTAGDFVSVWEGFWAEVDGGTSAPTFTLDIAFVASLQEPAPGGSETVSPSSQDKTEPASIEPRLSRVDTGPLSAINLRLRGTLDNGEEVVDLANRLRFEEDAMIGWDRHDGSKFMPPPATSSFALLSLEGVHNGDAYRQSVRSLPSGLDEEVTIPMSFLAGFGGSFEIQATPEGSPEGWTVTLIDHVTGAEVNLLNENYAFSGSAADWQDRFSMTVTPAGVVGAEDDPAVFRLSNATPNPARGSTALVLRVDEVQQVTVRVFDALGRTVATVHEGTFAAGEEARLEVDTSTLAAGTYVVRVEGETFSESRRFAVVR